MPFSSSVSVNLGTLQESTFAVDDFGQFFTVQEVHDLVENKQCVTKFRTFQYYQSKSISDSSLTGETLYIGSKKSDAYVRIYNKGLEQKVDMDWVRWEIQLRDERASAFLTWCYIVKTMKIQSPLLSLVCLPGLSAS